MMHNPGTPLEQAYWYVKPQKINTLSGATRVDVIVIGGGMAGLTAAQSFAQRGLKVALLEQYYCGSGATGKSSGFITPDAELNLTRFDHLYGKEVAHLIWEFIKRGIETIKTNITTYALDCDYQEQDTLVLANSRHAARAVHQEHQNRLEQKYQSRWYSKETCDQVIGSQGYFGGCRYDGTFAINAFKYAQGMKRVIQDMGVAVYEETPVLELHADHVKTPTATVHAAQIVVCADRFIPNLGKLNNDIFNIQSHILLSHSLPDSIIQKIFPDKPCQAWDSDLIYTFFRLTHDNRFLIGGGDYWHTYRSKESYHAHSVYNKLNNYVQTKFPEIRFTFEYMWPGLIGVSKNIAPVMGRDETVPSIYYAGAAAGLPIAASMGAYSAEHIVDGRTDLDEYFKPNRSSTASNIAQAVIGKPATFALSNFYTILTS